MELQGFPALAADAVFAYMIRLNLYRQGLCQEKATR